MYLFDYSAPTEALSDTYVGFSGKVQPTHTKQWKAEGGLNIVEALTSVK